MKLGEFLRVCNRDDYIGIYDMDTRHDQPYKSADRFQIHPTKQHYMKIGKIPYGRIGRFLDYEIMMINHNEKGYFVRIHSQKNIEDMKNWRLAMRIRDEFKRR